MPLGLGLRNNYISTASGPNLRRVLRAQFNPYTIISYSSLISANGKSRVTIRSRLIIVEIKWFHLNYCEAGHRLQDAPHAYRTRNTHVLAPFLNHAVHVVDLLNGAVSLTVLMRNTLYFRVTLGKAKMTVEQKLFLFCWARESLHNTRCFSCSKEWGRHSCDLSQLKH